MALSEAIPIAMTAWGSQAQPILRRAPWRNRGGIRAGEYAAKSRQLTYNGISAPEARHRLVKTPSLEAKKAYCAKTRRSNYAASLRLEGYEVTESDAARELPSREAVLRAYRKQA